MHTHTHRHGGGAAKKKTLHTTPIRHGEKAALTRSQEGGHGQHAQREAQLGDATHGDAVGWVRSCGCVVSACNKRKNLNRWRKKERGSAAAWGARVVVGRCGGRNAGAARPTSSGIKGARGHGIGLVAGKDTRRAKGEGRRISRWFGLFLLCGEASSDWLVLLEALSHHNNASLALHPVTHTPPFGRSPT